MGNFATKIVIKAPVTKVWQVLSATGDIHYWNPGVKASRTTSKQTEGVGATRFCDLGGKNYLDEEVVVWQPNEKLTMRITGTNLPFAAADVHFSLRANDNDTQVTVSPLYKLKYGVIGELMDKLVVRNSYQRGMEALLAGLKAFVEKQA